MSELTVGPIQNYVEGSTWFDLTKYSSFGRAERTSVNLVESDLWLVDPSQLFIEETYAPRIAFLNEGAGYQSPIDISVTGNTIGEATVFENLSGTNSVLPNANGPLEVGDWVQLSTIQGGSQLNLSVTPNGVFNSNATPLSTDYNLNPTGPNPNAPAYWVAYADPNGPDPLLILGYEDIVGTNSDNDFNDGLLVLDIGRGNFESVFQNANFGQDPTINLGEARANAVPFEAETSIGLFLVLGMAAVNFLLHKRRRQNILLSSDV